MTTEEWKRAEILLEGIKKDIKLVAEGHEVIRREMQEISNELKENIVSVDKKVEFLGAEAKSIKKELREVSEKVNQIDRKLDEHMRQPAHALA